MRRHEPFSVLLINLGRKTKTFASGNRVGLAEPYTGERRPLFQGGVLAVQQGLEARREPDTEAAMTEAEGLPQPPIGPPAKSPKTPKVNRTGVSKDLHGKVHGLLDPVKVMRKGRLGELKAATHQIQLKPHAKPAYRAP